MTAARSEEILMQKNREMIKLNEHLTDAKIGRAIRYLDPDLCAERTGGDAGTLVGISIILLIVLTVALTCIRLYVRIL
jgi:hypothetical protein